MRALDRAGIAARIPHHGSMCLLDGVESWNDTQIHCQASSHTAPDNPLRAAGRLGLAVHGALRAGADGAPRTGYLTSVREVEFHAERLDRDTTPLDIHAECLSGDGNHLIYSFRLETAGRLLLTGRASVMLDAGAL